MPESNGIGVNWTPVDEKNNESKQKAEFVLGDFGIFGQFLSELVGNIQPWKEVSDA